VSHISSGRHAENGPTGAGQLEVEALADLVDRLAQTMLRGSIARLDVRYGDLKVSLRSGAVPARSVPMAAAEQTEDVVAWAESDFADQSSEAVHTVRSPMIGTFYAASAPNEPPFVAPGDIVEAGQTIAIVEAMKIMNEIAADRGGEIIEVVATNGQTVEFGSPLVRIRLTS
jgi:acetyl-CoA carboxylase biotin carboxyl carrier protein